MKEGPKFLVAAAIAILGAKECSSRQIQPTPIPPVAHVSGISRRCVVPEPNQGYYSMFGRQSTGKIEDYWEDGSLKGTTTFEDVNAGRTNSSPVAGGITCATY